MIPQTDVSWQTASWQEVLAGSIRDPEELLALLDLNPDQLAGALAATRGFPLRVPRPYLERIERGNPHDPLLLQILPTGREQLAVPGYGRDPVGDLHSNVLPGLIHKYHGRVLMVVNGHCAINCRYCFRRAFPYRENRPDRGAWRSAVDYVARDKTISEVIFSGGDPLASGDRQLAWLTAGLSAIPHVKRLRIHSRLPVVIPGRITDQCIAWMTEGRLKPVMVIHCNHANELDGQVRLAVAKLNEAGVTVLNQSVLLKGVNDSVPALEQLSLRLFDAGVMPYYLHLLDKVQGAAHFDLPAERAVELIAQLRGRLPGYLVPRLVQEVAGAPAKVVLG